MRKGLIMKKAAPYLLLLPALLLVLAFMGYPLAESVRISFLKYNLMQPRDIHFTGFDNYLKLFNDGEVPRILLNSVIWVVVVVASQFLAGFTLATLLYYSKFRGRSIYQSVVFLPWAVSGFLIGLTFKWIFAENRGILNYILMNLGILKESVSWLGDPKLSMIGPVTGMIWFGIPFFAIMILAAMQSIPIEIFESAKLDGAGAAAQLFRITIPYIKPTIIMTLLLRVIWVFNSPDVIYTMTGGGPANTSNILTLYVFNQAFYSMDFGYGAAVGLFLMLILIIYALLFLRVTRYEEAGDF